MPSPPKPWERGSAASPAASTPSPALAPAPPATSSPASSTPPTVPDRPASLQASPYSSLQSSYTSPYSRFGAMGSTYSPYGSTSMYGGGMGSYGGYGNMGAYGGYNSLYGGGMGGMGYGGMGMGGMPMIGPNGLPIDPNNPSLTQTLESTTQHTFALLHSIVQTFTGVSQMLESTFMATHSSFFAMVGVVDQFSQLRNALGSVLGLFGLVRWMRELLGGKPAGMQGEFRDFINGKPVQGPLPPQPKASKKPLIIFLLAIVGIPFAMSKLIRILNERAQQQQQLQDPQNPNALLAPLDPSLLTFARALYPFNATTPSELSLKTNEIVAIMGKLDPSTGLEVDPRLEVGGGVESEWWKGRTREGREGWFPRKWVEVLERKEKKVD